MEFNKTRLIIVMSDFNISVTNSMKEAAIKHFLSVGGEISNINVINVPGAFEIPGAVSGVIKKGNADIIVAIGCVIEGETPHFDYIATETAAGLAQVSLEYNIPVGFGVLTCDTMDQAIERSGEGSGNKGIESTEAVLGMIDFLHNL